MRRSKAEAKPGLNIEAFGTTNWRAYALFRAGLSHSAGGRQESAEAVYLGAVRADPKFTAARINLGGVLMMDRPGGADLWFAIEQFQAVLEQFEPCGEGFQTEPVFFSALYQLSSAWYDFGKTDRALDFATGLMNEIKATREAIKEHNTSSDDERLLSYLNQVTPAANAMLIGLRIELGLATLADLRATDNRRMLSAQAHYNYACALAVAAKQSAGNDRTELFEEVSQRLHTAFRLTPALEFRAKSDRALQEWQAWRTRSDPERRMAYWVL